MDTTALNRILPVIQSTVFLNTMGSLRIRWMLEEKNLLNGWLTISFAHTLSSLTESPHNSSKHFIFKWNYLIGQFHWSLVLLFQWMIFSLVIELYAWSPKKICVHQHQLMYACDKIIILTSHQIFWMHTRCLNRYFRSLCVFRRVARTKKCDGLKFNRRKYAQIILAFFASIWNDQFR